MLNLSIYLGAPLNGAKDIVGRAVIPCIVLAVCLFFLGKWFVDIYRLSVEAGKEEQMNIQKTKETYKKGLKIKLIKWGEDDPHPVPEGTEGIINYVDDIGQIHVAWNNGQFLAISEEYGDVFCLV